MKLTMRRASVTDTWGYVEQFTRYIWNDKGYVDVVTSVSHNKDIDSFFFSKPYVLRGGCFVPLKDIDEEVGIDRYIKAKKPFYSLVGDGFVVHIKSRVDYQTGECDLSKSIVEALQYYSEESHGDEGDLFTKKILNMNTDLKNVLEFLAVELAKCKGDKEAFMRSRLY